ncbi:proteasome-activating nucleotidase [Phtheirospermum japonicum]|uniref:Proteasome-activating nucleotidase n=1 Tax=Phtheirospermum japonicum TaxID=374723 RepID=A0A830B891_9LAMI|nr:proteasome-activating nucleotidase [Phtheirospermum japonicum]
MVDLPDVTNRSKILKVILTKEELSDDVDFNAIAHMTGGFSGCDLKVCIFQNLCVTAAYHPVRELVKNDKVCLVHMLQIIRNA